MEQLVRISEDSDGSEYFFFLDNGIPSIVLQLTYNIESVIWSFDEIESLDGSWVDFKWAKELALSNPIVKNYMLFI